MSQPCDQVARGKRAKRKGKAGEQEIARLLRDVWPDAYRGAQSRTGDNAPDVDGTPLWIEVKRHARFAVLRHYEQACRDSDGRQPVVILREDNGPPMALLSLDDLRDLLGCAAEPDALERLRPSLGGEGFDVLHRGRVLGDVVRTARRRWEWRAFRRMPAGGDDALVTGVSNTLTGAEQSIRDACRRPVVEEISL